MSGNSTAGRAPALTYAELFAGGGGLSLGLETAGWHGLAHAEIEPHARAVLRAHWPDCRLDGDVSQLNGADYAGITLLSGGSPCQDLSVAGKRKGMTEGSGTRSALYFEQVRIRDESGAPYFLWENVLGAFSSNNGRDFAAVLSALVGAAIPVPADGWESAGVAAGPTGVAAWRVLDCQFFGPPQRRRRVFVLGARAGGVDPAEVLALSEGVRGDPPARREAGEGLAADAVGGTDGEEYISLVLGSDPISRVGGPSQPVTGRNGDPGVVLAVNMTYDARGNGDGATVNTMAGDHQNRVTDYTAIVLRAPRDGDVVGYIVELTDHATGQVSRVAQARAWDENEWAWWGTGNGSCDCNRGDFAGVEGVPCDNGIVRRFTVRCLTPDGSPLYVDEPPASQTFRLVEFGEYSEDGTASAVKARDYKDATDLVLPVVAPPLVAGAHPGGANGQDAPRNAAALLAAAPGVGIPRRLMPIETERLQGWPDHWTAEGLDENGTRYALSDTARYRLVGNGVASPVAAWIGWRLRWALEAQAAGG